MIWFGHGLDLSLMLFLLANLPLRRHGSDVSQCLRYHSLGATRLGFRLSYGGGARGRGKGARAG